MNELNKLIQLIKSVYETVYIQNNGILFEINTSILLMISQF